MQFKPVVCGAIAVTIAIVIAGCHSDTAGAINEPPTAPTTVKIESGAREDDTDLTVTGTGSTDPDGTKDVTYECQWGRSTDGGETWSDWGWAGLTLVGEQTSAGELWRFRIRATDGTTSSGWVQSDPIEIAVNVVSGYVRDAEDDSGVAGTEVAIGDVTAITNSEGQFQLTDVPTGSRTITVNPPVGYIMTGTVAAFNIDDGVTEIGVIYLAQTEYRVPDPPQ